MTKHYAPSVKLHYVKMQFDSSPYAGEPWALPSLLKNEQRRKTMMRRALYRGCLLGLAVGDAMGYTVDSRSWREIQEDYGPNGLLGYDLVNGYADVTS